MYQSLHTTVIGPYGERIEIQIRTHEMHRVAEHGIAAHWKYKGRRPVDAATTRSASPGCASCWSGSRSSQDPQEFLRSVKDDLFGDEVYVFTPKGDVLNFPDGRDGDRLRLPHPLRGRRPLRRRARQRHASCRCATSCRTATRSRSSPRPHQTPNKDWLKLVKTSRAKARIRAWIKAQQRSAQRRARPRAPRARPRAPPARPRRSCASDGTLERVADGARRQGRGDAARQRRLRQASPPQQVLAQAAARRGARAARASESEGTLQRLFRAASAGRPKRGVQVARRRRHAGALRQVLRARCPASASSASSRAAAASPCTRSTARRCSRATRSAASTWSGTNGKGTPRAGHARGDLRRPARPARRDVARRSARPGINIARAQVHALGDQQGAEHLRGHGRRAPTS